MIRNGPPGAVEEPHVIRGTTQGATADTGGESVVDLLKQLAGQGSHLAEQQLALIKAEMRESTNELKVAAGAMAGAAVVALAGLGVFLMGIAYLIGDAIDSIPWATVIVGAATLGLAYILYRSGASKMQSAHLTPDRTQRTLQRTPDAIRGDLPTEQNR